MGSSPKYASKEKLRMKRVANISVVVEREEEHFLHLESY
jgi:hypothetical protein